MKFEILAKSIDSDFEWWEDYDIAEITTLEQAQEWAKTLMDNYNKTLRPQEVARELLDVRLVGAGVVGKEHQWVKIMPLAGNTYDVYRCSVCGVTGKRYGTSGGIKRDSKYKAKKYEFCKDKE